MPNDSPFTSQDFIDYRESLGMTQEQFSKAFGISIANLHNWEQGRAMPKISPAKLLVFSNVINWKKKTRRK